MNKNVELMRASLKATVLDVLNDLKPNGVIDGSIYHFSSAITCNLFDLFVRITKTVRVDTLIRNNRFVGINAEGTKKGNTGLSDIDIERMAVKEYSMSITNANKEDFMLSLTYDPSTDTVFSYSQSNGVVSGRGWNTMDETIKEAEVYIDNISENIIQLYYSEILFTAKEKSHQSTKIEF